MGRASALHHAKIKSIPSVCICVVLDIDLCYKKYLYKAQHGEKFTHLIRKHIASDLVGNNLRIICEDVVQNRAVILS